MAERVRLLDYEAADVHRAVEDYLDAVEISEEESHTYGNIVAATDLVNAIGEIYETALTWRMDAASQSRGAAG